MAPAAGFYPTPGAGRNEDQVTSGMICEAVSKAGYGASLLEEEQDRKKSTETIFTQTYPIDILAYDQWGGINIFPEMLAAFILSLIHI